MSLSVPHSPASLQRAFSTLFLLSFRCCPPLLHTSSIPGKEALCAHNCITIADMHHSSTMSCVFAATASTATAGDHQHGHHHDDHCSYCLVHGLLLSLGPQSPDEVCLSGPSVSPPCSPWLPSGPQSRCCRCHRDQSTGRCRYPLCRCGRCGRFALGPGRHRAAR